jgi:hypothetical protein
MTYDRRRASCRPSGVFTSDSTVRMPYIFGEALRAQSQHARVAEPVTARLCNSEQPHVGNLTDLRYVAPL